MGMAPSTDYSNLVTALVLSKRLGLTRTQRVHQLVARQADPMPGHVWAQPRVHLWHWPDVRAWAHRQSGLEVLEPGHPATREQVRHRLGMEPDLLGPADEKGTWDWGIAEEAWIRSTMNVHQD